MTAFARESVDTDQGNLTVELRSVNHRYLDCSFKLPDLLRPLEPRLREQASGALARGKLDCLIRVQSHPGQSGEWQLDEQQLARLLAAANQVEQHLDNSRPLSALEVLQFPGVCSTEDRSEEVLQKAAAELFAKALGNLKETRLREGEKLAKLVLDRLQQVDAEVESTRAVLPQLMQQQRERVIARIEELGMDVDQDRLEAHISEIRRALDKGGPCGRRLDFLMQELNREANTLGSKSADLSTTQASVELKVLIEQMREQIQNIE